MQDFHNYSTSASSNTWNILVSPFFKRTKFSSLIDEEGLLKPNKANLVGCYLYEYHKHGHPIVGNILFVGEKVGNDGIEFCGISEENFVIFTSVPDAVKS